MLRARATKLELSAPAWRENPLREGGVHGGDVVRVSDTDRTVVERGCDPSLDEGGEERERERETHRSCSRW